MNCSRGPTQQLALVQLLVNNEGGPEGRYLFVAKTSAQLTLCEIRVEVAGPQVPELVFETFDLCEPRSAKTCICNGICDYIYIYIVYIHVYRSVSEVVGTHREIVSFRSYVHTRCLVAQVELRQKRTICISPFTFRPSLPFLFLGLSK